MPPPNQPFSKRKGYSAEPKEITIREEAPENLRYCVLQVAIDLGWNPSALRDIICRVLREVPDSNNWSEYPNIWHEVQQLLSGCEWYKVYDIIEAFYAHFAEYDADNRGKTPVAPRFVDEINSFFFEKGIGWQLIKGEIVTRGDEAFEGTVRKATKVLEDDEKPTAAGHLRFAVNALSTRPKPNTSGAVAHATSAVECVLGEITGHAMTLGKYLDKYPSLFHPALKKGLDGIYGYASDEGARHGKEGTEPAREEAEFVVVACAAVCCLLTRKQSSAHQ
jgi:AbiJ N-terminal domain 4